MAITSAGLDLARGGFCCAVVYAVRDGSGRVAVARRSVRSVVEGCLVLGLVNALSCGKPTRWWYCEILRLERTISVHKQLTYSDLQPGLSTCLTLV